MARFQPGDRVTLTSDYGSVRKGTSGVITDYPGWGSVKWPCRFEGQEIYVDERDLG